MEYIIPRDPSVKHEYMHTQLKLSKMLQIFAKNLLEFLKEVYENDNFCFINYEEIKKNNLDVLYFKSNLYKTPSTIDIIMNININTIHLWNSEIKWISTLLYSSKKIPNNVSKIDFF